MPTLIRQALSAKSVINVDNAMGIEIELEGLSNKVALPVASPGQHIAGVGMVGTSVISPWATAHVDGSLRNGGIEFVTKVLFNFKECNEALKVIEKCAQEHKLVASNRAGIHVHENLQELTFSAAWNYLLWYILFEPALFDFIGEGRERSIYSRPLHSHLSGEELRGIRDTFKAGILPNLSHKYWALNICSLQTFGTVEYRHMKSTLDFGRIEQWLHIIRYIKTLATESGDPGAIKADDVIKLVPKEWTFVDKKRWLQILNEHCIPLICSASSRASQISWKRGSKSANRTAAIKENPGYTKFMSSGGKKTAYLPNTYYSLTQNTIQPDLMIDVDEEPEFNEEP